MDASSRITWLAAVVGLVGLWLVVGAVLWGTSPFLHWNDVVAGIVVVIVAGYGAYESHEAYSSGGDNGSGSDSGSSENSDSDADDNSDEGSDEESSDDSNGE